MAGEWRRAGAFRGTGMHLTFAVITLLLALDGSSASAPPSFSSQFVRMPLSDPRALCNDGNPASIYVRRVADPAAPWVVFLQGGNQCTSPSTCAQRRTILPVLTSPLLTNTAARGPFPSPSLLSSPPLNTANAVFIPYCSSDAWLGEGVVRSVGGFSLFGGNQFIFSGRRILEAAVTMLRDEYGMGQGLTIMSGCSAGAYGMAYNIDHVCGLLEEGGGKCVGVLDSAWWTENGPDPLGSALSLAEEFEEGVQFWGIDGPIVNEECTQAVGEENKYRCMFGQNAFAHIKTPVLLHVEQHDEYLVEAVGLAGSFISASSQAGQEWIGQAKNTTRQALSATFGDNNTGNRPKDIHPSSSVYAPSCYRHCIILDSAPIPNTFPYIASSLYDRIQIAEGEHAGRTFAQTVTEWLAAIQGDEKWNATLMLDTCEGFDCSVCP